METILIEDQRSAILRLIEIGGLNPFYIMETILIKRRAYSNNMDKQRGLS